MWSNLTNLSLSCVVYRFYSWDLAFYASGFFILVSGFLAYVTAILEDREELANKNKEKAQQLNLPMV